MAKPSVTLLPTSNGIPYLPDDLGLTQPPLKPGATWVRIVIFVICYVALQALYAQCGGTAVEKFFLERLGSRPAATLIDMLQPTLEVHAVGTRITASRGGGINIGNGCEGTDLYFLLSAAFAAASLSWHLRGIGLGIGLILAFVLNQARIIALFHAYRLDPSLFNLLHTSVAPILLVVILALYFHAWLRYSQRPA